MKHEEQKREEVSKCCVAVAEYHPSQPLKQNKIVCSKCGKPFIPDCKDCQDFKDKLGDMKKYGGEKRNPYSSTTEISDVHVHIPHKEEKEEILYCDRQNGSKGKTCKCTCHQEDYPLPRDFSSPKTDKSWEDRYEEFIYKFKLRGCRDVLKAFIENQKSLSYAEGEKNNLAKLIEECGEDFSLESGGINDTKWLAQCGNFDIDSDSYEHHEWGRTPEEAVKNLLAQLKEKKV